MRDGGRAAPDVMKVLRRRRNHEINNNLQHHAATARTQEQRQQQLHAWEDDRKMLKSIEAKNPTSPTLKRAVCLLES